MDFCIYSVSKVTLLQTKHYVYQTMYFTGSNVVRLKKGYYSMKNKQMVASLSGLILLMVLIVTSIFWAYGQIETFASARKHTFIVLNHADDFMSALKDAETGYRGYLMTGNETFLQPYLEVQGSLRGQLKDLRQLCSISGARKHLDTIGPLLDAKMANMLQGITLRRNSSQSAAFEFVAGGQGKRLMDLIRGEMRSFMKIEEGALAQYDAEFQSKMFRLFTIIVLASVLMMLCALAFGYFIYRQSQQKLKDLIHLETVHLLETTQSLFNELEISKIEVESQNAELQRSQNELESQQIELEMQNDELRLAREAAGQLETVLRESEEKLEVTLNSIGDGVIATDAQARVTLLNPIAEQLTGWTETEAIGQPVDVIFNIINKDTRQPAAIPVMEAIAHGTIQGLANHTVLIARDGSEYDIADSCAPIRNRDDQVVGAVLVFRDVTEEYAVQQSLRDGSALVQTILNTVVDGIITIHARGGLIETVNQAAVKMFGYTATELTGQSFGTLIPELDLDQQNGSLEYYSASKEECAVGLGREVMGRRKDGRFFPLEMTTSEMELGGQRYFTGILREISVRKQVEEERKRLDQQLRENEELFRTLADNISQLTWIGDAQGSLFWYNKQWFDYTGTTLEEMCGWGWQKVHHPDHEQRVVEKFKHCLDIGAVWEDTFPLRGVDGKYRLFLSRALPIRDEHGKVLRWFGTNTDITEREQAGALQNAIFNSANFSSIATDAKGVIQIFNVGAERMLGYSADEVMNKITPADISDPQEVITRARALSSELDTPITPGFEALVFKASRGIEDIYELTYIRKDGSRFPAVVSVTALRDAQDTIIGYLLIGTDNTARKQIEEEQKQLSQRLRDHQFYTRSLFESNIDAIMTTDPSGIITDVNKQMEMLTECTRDELIGAPFKNYFTDPARAETGIQQVLNEKKVTNYELTARTRDGKETVVSFNATTFFDRDRKLQGVFAAARDVTERKQLDQELERAKSAAEKANLAKSDFLSSMSHELRTPLGAILGFAQLLESGSPQPTPVQKRGIDQILQAGWYLLELINEILDLALIESGKLSMSVESVSLPEIMHECEAMIEPQAKKQGIGVNFINFDTPYFVKADRVRVKQVLINLLSNSIKYNRVGGKVVVESAMCLKNSIRISVRDTGEGLAPEQLAQLFQPFNRLGQEASSEQGTGIGLTVSKRLIESMGGIIGVDSTVGEGSVFWIELELTIEPQAIAYVSERIEDTTMQVQGNVQLYSLLYVEDNPANLMLVEDIIARRTDIRLLSARNGKSGIELARASLPDVILMDINLPDISGLQALKILAGDPATANIPVVALSANAIPRDIANGLEAGFFRYLTKPIKVNEFMDTLDIALNYAKEEAALTLSAHLHHS
jgi:PAS domain S-box-containing protein